MASPQIENGYTKIANEIMDALCMTRIRGEAYQVLSFILRMTYGWGKKESAISLKEFSQATGMKKAAVIRAIYHLQDINIISVQKNNDGCSVYKFNKDYESWKPLSKKIMVFVKKPILKDFCYVCGFQEATEKHHIIPRSENGPNQNSNLIALCPNCHTLAHKGKITRDELLSKKIMVESIVIKNDNAPKTVNKNDNGFDLTFCNDSLNTVSELPTKTVIQNDNDEKTIIKNDNGFEQKQQKPLSKMITVEKDTYYIKERKKERKPSMSFFDEFWKVYPRKEAKEKARVAWKKINPDETLFKIMSVKIDELKKTEQWNKDNGSFIPYPATWLNGRRWEDEIKIETQKPVNIKRIATNADIEQLLN